MAHAFDATQCCSTFDIHQAATLFQPGGFLPLSSSPQVGNRRAWSWLLEPMLQRLEIPIIEPISYSFATSPTKTMMAKRTTRNASAMLGSIRMGGVVLFMSSCYDLPLASLRLTLRRDVSVDGVDRRLDLLQPFGMRWTPHSATSGRAGPPKSNDIHRMPRQPRQLAPTGSDEPRPATDVTARTNPGSSPHLSFRLFLSF